MRWNTDVRGLDGPIADAEATGDLLVGQPLTDQVQHLELTLRQVGRSALTSGPGVEQLSCGLGVQR